MKRIAAFFKAIFDFLALVFMGQWFADHDVPPFQDEHYEEHEEERWQ